MGIFSASVMLRYRLAENDTNLMVPERVYDTTLFTPRVSSLLIYRTRRDYTAARVKWESWGHILILGVSTITSHPGSVTENRMRQPLLRITRRGNPCHRMTSA